MAYFSLFLEQFANNISWLWVLALAKNIEQAHTNIYIINFISTSISYLYVAYRSF